jgi:hypothetical protein
MPGFAAVAMATASATSAGSSEPSPSTTVWMSWSVPEAAALR